MTSDREFEQRIAGAAAAWPDLRLGTRVAVGDRSAVWRGELDGAAVSVRASRRSVPSLEWELDLLNHLDDAGVGVARPIHSRDQRLHVDGVVVQPWIEGREPSDEADWRAVGDALMSIHRLGTDVGQRPGCSAVTTLRATRRSVDADLDAMPDELVDELCTLFESYDDVATSVIHGDPHADNIKIIADGAVVLLDFDESRVDLVWHDLSNLGVQMLDTADHKRAMRLSDAWEAANAWIPEPDYARQRLESLRG